MRCFPSQLESKGAQLSRVSPFIVGHQSLIPRGNPEKCAKHWPHNYPVQEAWEALVEESYAEGRGALIP